MAAPGRNSRCPCGSGLKYKKCCGLPPNAVTGQNRRKALFDIGASMAHKARADAHRDGNGRGIVSAEFQGARYVAVDQQIHSSSKWKTFTDFLFDYPSIKRHKWKAASWFWTKRDQIRESVTNCRMLISTRAKVILGREKSSRKLYWPARRYGGAAFTILVPAEAMFGVLRGKLSIPKTPALSAIKHFSTTSTPASFFSQALVNATGRATFTSKMQETLS